MSKKSGYRDEPLEMEVVPDFLPPPDKLVLKRESVKVTISLSKPSVEFFKAKAREQGAPYQKMIRRVLDVYAERYKDA